MANGRPGRAPGQPNMDKIELRALIQERVQEFTQLRQEEDIRRLPPDMPLEEAMAAGMIQQVEEEYDPVVALALVAVDRRSSLDQQIRCHAEVAQYVRAKLKSIEVKADASTIEELEQRREKTDKLMAMLDQMAKDKKATSAEPK